MSNDLRYTATVYLKPGSNADEFQAAFDAAVGPNEDGLELEEVSALDPRIPEIISFEINTYGTGGHIDDRQVFVAEFLNQISAVGGVMEVCDMDMSPSSSEAILKYTFGPTPQHKAYARVKDALEEFMEATWSVLTAAQRSAIKMEALIGYAAEVQEENDYRAQVEPKPAPSM